MLDNTRQTVTLQGRSLHLRRFGKGPPVVLLHESPRSSAVLLPLAEMLAEDFTVFALDTPGYGLSDALPLPRPNAEDFADAIAASLRALGLNRAAIYGTHTGASIAIALARRHPDLVAGAVLDGYAVFTPEEGDLHACLYLPAFDPAWDGSHVARLWSRVRDQYTFFPWYQPGRGNRLRRDPPQPTQQTAVIRDLLAAGPSYAAGYESAFRMDGVAALRDVAVPLCFTCREDDLLFPHLDRLPALPPTMSIVRLGSDRPAWGSRIGREMADMIGVTATPDPVFKLEGHPQGALCALDGTLLARCYDTGARLRTPLVLLHDLPGRSRDWHGLAQSEAQHRLVIAIDLPGAGVSPAGAGAHGDIAALVAALMAGLAAHGIAACDLGGRGLGALLALELDHAMGRTAGRILLLDPPPLAEAVPAAIPAPDWHGGHLMAAWYEARDRMLFRPPHGRSGAAVREVGPGLDVGAVHAAFTARILADPGIAALEQAVATLARDLAARDLARCGVVLRSGDPDAAELAQALDAAGASVRTVPYDLLADAAASALRAPALRAPG